MSTPSNSMPPPLPAPTPPAAPSSQATTVLILTIIAGVLSIAIGGCTSAFVGGVADMGDNISDFQRSMRAHGDADTTRREAAAMRSSASGHALFGLIGAALSVTGGIMAFRHYNSSATQTIGGKTFRKLTLAGSAIAAAAVLTFMNVFALFTAGILNTIAAVLTLVQARKL